MAPPPAHPLIRSTTKRQRGALISGTHTTYAIALIPTSYAVAVPQPNATTAPPITRPRTRPHPAFAPSPSGRHTTTRRHLQNKLTWPR